MPLGLATTVKGIGVTPTGVASSAPPSNFREAEEVRAAWFCSSGPFSRTSSRGGSPAMRAGKRYEKKALKFLKDSLGDDLRVQPWLRFTSHGRERWCQPDAVFVSETPIIFEIKVTYTPDAWWQMRKALSSRSPPRNARRPAFPRSYVQTF